MRARSKVMKMQRLYLVAVVLSLLTVTPARALPQSQTSSNETQELRKQLGEMREQMNKLEARLGELESSKPTEAAKPPVAPSATQGGTIESTRPPLQGQTSRQVGEATASYQEFSEDSVAAARFNNVPLDPKYNGFFQLPGTQTILKIGGYYKTDFIYDLKPAGNADAFVPSSFPIPQPIEVNNTTISIR